MTAPRPTAAVVRGSLLYLARADGLSDSDRAAIRLVAALPDVILLQLGRLLK